MENLAYTIIAAAVVGIASFAYKHPQEYAQYYWYLFVAVSFVFFACFGWNLSTDIAIEQVRQEVYLLKKEVNTIESILAGDKEGQIRGASVSETISKVDDALSKTKSSLQIPRVWLFGIYLSSTFYFAALLSLPQLFKKPKRDE